MKSTAVILLAAGSSSRMGRSKQSLIVNNESLLTHSAKIAIESGLHTTIVLGAHEPEHRTLLKDLNVDIVVNENWEKGMGNSLKAGLQHILVKTTIDSIIVMVCDQILLTTAHLFKLKESFDFGDKLIAASYYMSSAGVPALFDRKLFSEILSLPDHLGAKSIIENHPAETIIVDFPDGNVDLDTMEDVKKYLGK